MKDNEIIKSALDKSLSSLSVSPQRRARIRAAIIREEEVVVKRKISFAAAVAMALAMIGAIALATGTDIMSIFAEKDERYKSIQEQVTENTEEPTVIQDDALGTVSVRIDSTYFDGQSLILTVDMQNAEAASEWTPDEEELKQMETVDSNCVMELTESPTSQETEILEKYRQAKSAGKPYGYKLVSVWLHDNLYTDTGIELNPVTGNSAVGDNDEQYQILEYTIPNDEIVGDDILKVHAQLGKSTVYRYFDGQNEYYRADVQRDDVGSLTAAVPKSDADIATFTGSGTLCGAQCTITAKVSAVNVYLTITADDDIFPLTNREGYAVQTWSAALYDENGIQFTSGSETQSASQLIISFDGNGSIPKKLKVYVYNQGVDEGIPDEAEILSGDCIELTR